MVVKKRQSRVCFRQLFKQLKESGEHLIFCKECYFWHTTLMFSWIPSKFFNSRKQTLNSEVVTSSAQMLTASWTFFGGSVWITVRNTREGGEVNWKKKCKIDYVQCIITTISNCELELNVTLANLTQVSDKTAKIACVFIYHFAMWTRHVGWLRCQFLSLAKSLPKFNLSVPLELTIHVWTVENY